MASYLLPRPFPYNASRFRFVFRMHLVAVIGLALVAVLLLRLSPNMVFIAYLLIFCMAMVILLTVVNALPPVRTAHSVDGEFLVLRQGLGFKLAVPLSRISKAKRTEGSSGKMGIKLYRANSTLEVLASDTEAVRLRLNEPIRYKGVDVDTIIVDVLEPRDFIDCIRERKKGASLLEKLGPGREPAAPPAPGDERVDEAEQTENTGDGREGEEEHAAPAGKAAGETGAPASQGREEEVQQQADEDVIELVPALPSEAPVSPRVVRIPRRKP